MPGNEVTLADLVDDTGSAEKDGGDSDTGEWVMEVFDRLEKRGLIEPLIFGPDAAQDVQDQQNATTTTPDMNGDTPGGAGELDAQAIKTILLQVYDHAEMVPGLSDDPTVSELVQFVDSKPQLVDRLIQQTMGE